LRLSLWSPHGFLACIELAEGKHSPGAHNWCSPSIQGLVRICLAFLRRSCNCKSFYGGIETHGSPTEERVARHGRSASNCRHRRGSSDSEHSANHDGLHHPRCSGGSSGPCSNLERWTGRL